MVARGVAMDDHGVLRMPMGMQWSPMGRPWSLMGMPWSPMGMPCSPVANHGNALIARGNSWQCHGRSWSSMDTAVNATVNHEMPWSSMAINGHPWDCHDRCGNLWQCHGRPWQPMVNHDHTIFTMSMPRSPMVTHGTMPWELPWYAMAPVQKMCKRGGGGIVRCMLSQSPGTLGIFFICFVFFISRFYFSVCGQAVVTGAAPPPSAGYVLPFLSRKGFSIPYLYRSLDPLFVLRPLHPWV